MSFKDFQFHPKVHAGIQACGFTNPTPIQKRAIPPILEGSDILGLSQTGTGKTAAFVLPLLQRLLQGPRKRVRALIMAPTRELAEQIHYNICVMGKPTGLRSVAVFGGVGKNPQINAIRSGAEIIVACPGRLLDLLNDKHFSLGAVEVLVLDEADHMFDKGFLPDMKRIIRQVPKKRQSLIFSATMPEEIKHLTKVVLKDPVRIQIHHNQPTPTISHALFQVEKNGKTPLLKSLIKDREMTSTLIFTRTKHKARSLAINLQKAGFSAISMQGNLSQQKRKKAMEGFRDGTFKIMVATDIAARGIDVHGISHVINYDLPDTVETYTHRTGRTGRAQNFGHALTFAAKEESKQIRLIERNLGIKLLPDELSVCLNNKNNVIDGNPVGSPQGMRKKKPPVTGNRKKRRGRACAIDFGINNASQKRS